MRKPLVTTATLLALLAASLGGSASASSTPKQKQALTTYLHAVAKQYTILSRASALARSTLSRDFNDPAVLGDAAVALGRAHDMSAGAAVALAVTQPPRSLRPVHTRFVVGARALASEYATLIPPLQALGLALTAKSATRVNDAVAQLTAAGKSATASSVTWQTNRLVWKTAVARYARSLRVSVPSWVAGITA